MEEDLTGTFWYFAIGSMINKTSISLRGIYPKVTKPAELMDFELYFFGSGGMAEALPKEGSSFHGVVHAMTDAQMKDLDSMEGSMKRMTGKAKLYDGSVVEATVYTRPIDIERNKEVDFPPSQRYIDIITEGCSYWGV